MVVSRELALWAHWCGRTASDPGNFRPWKSSQFGYNASLSNSHRNERSTTSNAPHFQFSLYFHGSDQSAYLQRQLVYFCDLTSSDPGNWLVYLVWVKDWEGQIKRQGHIILKYSPLCWIKCRVNCIWHCDISHLFSIGFSGSTFYIFHCVVSRWLTVVPHIWFTSTLLIEQPGQVGWLLSFQ